jgi:hypothetical protein
MPIEWKMQQSKTGYPISESAIPDIVAGLGNVFGPQVGIHVVTMRSPDKRRGTGADFLVRIVWGGEQFEFAVEAKLRSTPRAIDEAVLKARRWAAGADILPMVIVPYLNEERIERLSEEGVSGLDLCGNGLVMVPGRLLLRRSGQPNLYPESRPSRFAYRGATSQVPRAFLRRGEYASVGRIKEEIDRADGSVALSTVSKALARMADDLVIDRSDDRIALLQAEKLLESLAEDFISPKAERRASVKLDMTLAELFRRVGGASASATPARIVLTGSSSQDRYSAGVRGDAPAVYVKDLDAVRRALGESWQPTERFAGLTVIETLDPTPFFDSRRAEDGVRFASPVQTYLELATSNDKRDAEMAQQILSRILRDIERRTGAP